jgi:hypothetical protein
VDHAQALWELEQIKRLKSRYYRLQDQNRWDDWSELFTEDCEIADPIDPAVKQWRIHRMRYDNDRTVLGPGAPQSDLSPPRERSQRRAR